MGILVSVSALVRMVALGFVLGIVVGLYFGISARVDLDSTECGPDRSAVTQCASPTEDVPPVGATYAPEAAP